MLLLIGKGLLPRHSACFSLVGTGLRMLSSKLVAVDTLHDECAGSGRFGTQVLETKVPFVTPCHA